MTVDDFFQKICDIPNKNNGGCLLFCYLFYLQFRECEIVQYSGWGSQPIQTNIEFLEGKRERATSSSHFTWIYHNVEYDSEGIYNEEADWKYVPLKAVLPLGNKIDEFCVNALRYGSWNPQFRRKTTIPLLEKRFGISLEHIL